MVEYGSKRFLIADSPAGTNFLTDLEKLAEEVTEELDEAAEKISGSFAGKLEPCWSASDEHHDEHKTNGG